MSPTSTFMTSAKVSCLSWSPYASSDLAFSDYRGQLQLLDVFRCKVALVFKEHTKRAWSCHFNPADSSVLATASDDNTVKLWSVNHSMSIFTIRGSANICSVKFSEDGRKIAYGGADHRVAINDLRMLGTPLLTLEGHKKSVSYVSFLSSNELVTSSTDSTIRLWDIDAGEQVCQFHGHRNERNFVGLALTHDYIACGSETNDIHIYCKGSHSPIISTPFGGDSSFLFANALEKKMVQSNSSGDSIGKPFVSALAWRKNHPDQMVVGNSHGIVKTFSLSKDTPHHPSDHSEM